MGYADDLAMLVTEDTVEDVEAKAREGLERVRAWMTANDLRLTPQKAEAMMFEGEGAPSPA